MRNQCKHSDTERFVLIHDLFLGHNTCKTWELLGMFLTMSQPVQSQTWKRTLINAYTSFL